MINIGDVDKACTALIQDLWVQILAWTFLAKSAQQAPSPTLQA